MAHEPKAAPDDFAGDLADPADRKRIVAWQQRIGPSGYGVQIDADLTGTRFFTDGVFWCVSPEVYARLCANLARRGVDVAQLERDFVNRN